MKKIFCIFGFFCAVLFSAAVFACSQNSVVMRGGIVTGAACSIKELNLEKNKSVIQKTDFLPMGEKDFKPIKLNPTRPLSSYDDCLFGSCLYKEVLKLEQ
jgi:hypothetical protein